jgi:hypothetical protein
MNQNYCKQKGMRILCTRSGESLIPHLEGNVEVEMGELSIAFHPNLAMRCAS